MSLGGTDRRIAAIIDDVILQDFVHLALEEQSADESKPIVLG